MPNQIVSKTPTQGRPYASYGTTAAVFFNSIQAKPAVYHEPSRVASQFLMIIIKISVNHFYDFH